VCETCSVTIREGHWLRVFEVGCWPKIFVSKWQDVRGGWRTLRNGEPYDSYSSSYLRSMRWVGHVAQMVEKRRILLGKPERKRQLERYRRR